MDSRLQVPAVDHHSSGPHPRPLMQRDSWQSLNGEWDFYDGRAAAIALPAHAHWDRKIQVPFSPETEASGIADTGFYKAVWYRRSWEQKPVSSHERVLLHFEAVDWRATVWVNGQAVCTHEGGYTPFLADITHALLDQPLQEVVVCAEDDPADLAKPRGKQDWREEPHSIWYPRTTGIWQTVWLETVSSTRIGTLQWSSNLERWEICLESMIFEDGAAEKADESDDSGAPLCPLRLSVRLTLAGELVAEDSYVVVAGEVHRRIALSDPGIDDFRNTLLWSPASPTLLDAEVELRDARGRLLDAVHSYASLRSVAIQGDRFILNGRPLLLRLVLDQGYWIDTGLTAPDDEALRRDIELVKQMGFNGVRKHQKIESARFLYWADRMGLLVWEEMPSAYRYTNKSIHRLTREWLAVIERDRSHPCIVAWVPFNESWGVPNLPESPAQRHYVQSLYHMTKALDPSRPVIGNDGWENVATDIIGIHDYDDNPERIGLRYGINDVESRLLQRERPGGRILTLGGETSACKQPIVLTEFGGIAFGGEPDESWGYSRSRTHQQLLDRYQALLECVRSLPALAGFCYTQLTDTYQEVNGLLYADRTPKLPLEAVAQATSGMKPDHDPALDMRWRDHLMQQDY
ncbi:glycoside hydrolase family 2 protein [Acidipila sp. EB88]|uniref:glycoside hydrolase family 2 protein n=1 Tax=Acidipila sp. EB88 TaxID=2305226 RepID=UPI000F5EFB16|nr:glycoside hydrolase family 2 TIM barrel-domain containing protein [Acidipila sp. EB88]RRA49100.1 glycoside hydrolase family 2 [Acidipila sp. EB88]